MYRRVYLSLMVMLFVVVGYLFPEYVQGGIGYVFSGFVLIFLLMIPGYWISLLFYDIEEISTFERIVMSLMISCALIPFLYRIIDYSSVSTQLIVWGYSATTLIIFVSMLAVIWKMDRL